MKIALTTRLARDSSGATIVEFAIVLPVMLMLIMGLGELTYQGYLQSVLTGAIQKAGRDSTIQKSNSSTIDAAVMAQVWQLNKDATYDSKRESYANFAAVAPEPFVDTAKTGIFDPTKDCFTDVNGNKTWDADPGANGQGGASDITLYTIHVYYARLFPVAALLGMSGNVTLTGTTILKNQPWTTQNSYAPKTCCPSTGCS